MTNPIVNHSGAYSSLKFVIANPNHIEGGFVPIFFCEIEDCGYDNLSHNDTPYGDHSYIGCVSTKIFVNSLLNFIIAKYPQTPNMADIRSSLIDKLKQIKKINPHSHPHHVWHELLDYISKYHILCPNKES